VPYQLVYSSWASPDLSMPDLEQVLKESRARNRAHGIGGVLILTDGIFLQILEEEK